MLLPSRPDDNRYKLFGKEEHEPIESETCVVSDREFGVIASRLVWGENEVEVSHQDTLKRLKALLEEREQLVDTLKGVAEVMVSSRYWAEHDGHFRLPVLTAPLTAGEGYTLVGFKSFQNRAYAYRLF